LLCHIVYAASYRLLVHVVTDVRCSMDRRVHFHPQFLDVQRSKVFDQVIRHGQ